MEQEYIVDNYLSINDIYVLYKRNNIEIVSPYESSNSFVNREIPPHNKTKIYLSDYSSVLPDCNICPATKNLSLAEGLQIFLADILTGSLSLTENSKILVCRRTFLKGESDRFVAISVAGLRVCISAYNLEPQSDILFERKVISREEAT